MLKKAFAGCLAASLLLAAALLGRRWLPPYELGLHSVNKGSASHAPYIGPCPLFPPDNIWNTPIDHLPLLAKSRVYAESAGYNKKIHADFGSNLNYGIPYTEIPFNTPSVPVSFEYRDDSDLGDYPIPAAAPIEGGPDPSGDRHVLLVDTAKCVLYELYHAEPQRDGSWTAGSGITMDLTQNTLRPEGKTSADAAGLPILPGLVRYDEVASGEIRHALRFTLSRTQNTFVWPARHRASPTSDPTLPPMGTRFRLRAGFDTSSYPRSTQVIMNALKHYGMFLADNGSPLYLSGVSDKRWNNRDLRTLGAITAADLEAVDESSLQTAPGSARATQPSSSP